MSYVFQSVARRGVVRVPTWSVIFDAAPFMSHVLENRVKLVGPPPPALFL
jgi:hypothetical protein